MICTASIKSYVAWLRFAGGNLEAIHVLAGRTDCQQTIPECLRLPAMI